MTREILAGVGALVLGWACATDVPALERRGFAMEVVVDGAARPEYPARGTTYVEALRGHDYVLRLSNPLPTRIAVALAVDGLNTIDARHTSAQDARKWVLEPYQTIEISGWQVSSTHARTFFFASEPQSYGAALGRTADLGVIEAVFFRERECCGVEPQITAGVKRGRERESRAAPAAPEAASRDKARGDLSEESAATGLGDRRSHPVHQIAMDLDATPAAVLRVRYEFRPQLVALGILPDVSRWPHRRERASGFTGSYCPEPD
jgi:hypothetical protein